MVGARGIGKSCVLRQLQEVGNQLDPNLAIGYVDLSSGDISQVAPSALLHGALQRDSKASAEKDPLSSQLEELARTGRRVALFYDEAEKLFSLDSPERLKFIKELDFIANTGFRSIYVLLCGSSAALPNLVSNNINEALRREYPLQTINLNGSKFCTLRMKTPPLFGDTLIAVNSYLPDFHQESQMKLARVLTFWAGPSLRLICRVLEDLAGQKQRGEVLLSRCLEERLWVRGDAPFFDDRRRNTYEKHGELINQLRDALVERNQDILDELLSVEEPGVLLEKISTLDYELCPLETRGVVDNVNMNLRHEDILLLVDKGWFLLSETHSLYPRSFAQLLFHAIYTKKEKQPGAKDKTYRFFHEMFRDCPRLFVNEFVKDGAGYIWRELV